MTGASDPDVGAPPLSVAQEALWYLSLLVPNQISYNEMITIRKDGPFDVASFRRAFNEIVRRHDAWHTTFDNVGGVPVQVVRPAPHFDLPILDLGALGLEEAEHHAIAMAAEVSKVPYDLRRGPLLRPRLVRFPGEHHRLYLGMHHIVFDGVSVYRVVLPELVALYDAFCAGRPSPLPEPETRYIDYARWEQHWITEPRAARRLAHWRQHLAQLPVLSIPTDHRRPSEQRFRGGMVALSVPKEIVARLRAVAQEGGATLFQVLATAWALLLGRYSGQDDVVFATAADLRQRPELESVVGYALTPLVVRVDLSGDPAFSDLVVRVRNEVLDGLDNLVPFERLVRELNPEGVSNANPVYQTMVILEPPAVAPDPSWSIHQMESEIGDAVGSAKLDLDLELDERPEGHISGRVIYDRDLFDATTATRVVAQWLRLVDAVAADPTASVSGLPVVTTDERRQLAGWNATSTIATSGAVHDLVGAQAARQPNAPAVSAGGEVISYAQLEHRAAQIGARLTAAGVVPGDLVALCAQPSVDLVAGALGVLQTGAGYVLVDPELAPERQDLVVSDSGAVAVLGDPALAGRIGAAMLDLSHRTDEEPAGATGPDADPGSVCCLQYTDGAKGPCGVRLRHESVANLCASLVDELGLGSADTVLVLPSTLFSVSATELWLPLIAGAKLVMAPADAATDGARLSRVLTAERISFLHASPSTWQTLIDSGLKATRGLAALSGGGELTQELADQLLGRVRVLWNAYGAPETTFYSTLARVDRAGPVTIGRPLANTRAYVLDAHDEPVPVGFTGRLVIAGVGVASGLGQRPGDVEGALVSQPGGSAPAYDTGDRAHWRTDGELTLASRATSP